MLWRKFNGDPIQLPIKQAVEETIKRETTAGNHLKVCIGTDSQVKGKETEFATVIVFYVKATEALCLFITKKLYSSTALKNACWLRLLKALKLPMNYATCLLCMMWIWKFMPTSTPIRSLKAMKH